MCDRRTHRHVYVLSIKAHKWIFTYKYKTRRNCIKHIQRLGGYRTTLDKIRLSRWYNVNYASMMIQRKCM